MIHRQLAVGAMDVFCYLVGCEETREAAVIDPGGDVEMIAAEARALGLTITTIINTHHHPDHTCGNEDLKDLTGAQVAIHRLDAPYISPPPDIELDQEKQLEVGTIELQIIHTPGHTRGGICLYTDGQLYTGDTLFVGDSGRTDLGGGDRPTLGMSLRMLMSTLPDDTVVWPGHDYGPTPSSTLAWEMRNNVNAVEYGFFRE